MRLAIVVAAMFACALPLMARERPIPPAPPDALKAPTGIDGVAPLLLELAALEAEGKSWVPHAMSGGATLRDQKQIAIEFNANGRYNLWQDGMQVGPELTFPAKLKESIAQQFPSAELIPTAATTMFRAWISPSQAAPMFALVRESVPNAIVAPYCAPTPAGYGAIVSEGAMPGRMYTEWYNSLGVDGTGVKVAVIDVGFKGIDGISAAEVGPYSKHPAQFNLNQDATEHGTACCEIIRDVAPGVELRVYRLDVGMDVFSAASDAIQWGAHIISVSLIWQELPQEGLACATAQMALNSGARWVNGAGNDAAGQYWESASVGLMNWGGLTYVDYDAPFQDPYQWIDGTWSGTQLQLTLAYEAPDATYARFALELWRWDGISPTLDLVASGTAGSTYQWIEHSAWGSPYSYFSLLRQTKSGPIGRMRQFVRGTYACEFYFSNTHGSVANPGSVPQLLTIGAVNQNNYYTWGAPEPYSSRGGGIWNLPLDYCAPTGCSCAAYGYQGFAGTSCATPHFAGLLACQIIDPGLDADPLGFLWTRDQGPPGWDPDSGLGAVLAYVDGSEQDNTSGTAFNLGSSSTTASGRLISPGVDVDWFRFSLASPQSVVLETLGNGNDDTVLTLYNSSLAFVAEDDDSGTGFFSRIHMPVLAAGTWYVTVESYNNASVVNGYSLTLTITPPSPPGPVPLISPADGATDLPLPVTLSWGNPGGTVTYQAEVAADGQFNNVVHAQQGLSTLSTTVSTLNYGTIYFWRIRAVNQYGEGPWSSRTFRTEEDLPGAPSPATPDAGALAVPLPVGFTWGVPATGTGPFTYEVQIAGNAGFTGPLHAVSGIATLSHAMAGLEHESLYYWRVRAANAQGDGPWSAPRAFTTATKKQASKSSPDPGGCATGAQRRTAWLLAGLVGAWAVRRRRRASSCLAGAA